jgi:hypothetical protein
MATKIKSLEKKENLSEWQRQQKEKKAANPNHVEYHYQHPEIDPWKLKKMEDNYYRENVPALKEMKFQFGAGRRNNKEVNRIINEYKIKAAQRNFDAINK